MTWPCDSGGYFRIEALKALLGMRGDRKPRLARGQFRNAKSENSQVITRTDKN